MLEEWYGGVTSVVFSRTTEWLFNPDYRELQEIAEAQVSEIKSHAFIFRCFEYITLKSVSSILGRLMIFDISFSN